MPTENPYVAPLATADDRPLPANAAELLALRQRYVYRETTLRAWGLAKLILAALSLVWSLLQYSTGLLAGYEFVGWTVGTLAGLFQTIAYFVLPGLGLWYLQRWSQWWQLVLGVWTAWFALGTGIWIELQLFPRVLIVAVNGSLVYLVTSSPSRAVLSKQYRLACEITTLHGITWPLSAKLFAFLIVELIQFAALYFLLIAASEWF